MNTLYFLFFCKFFLYSCINDTFNKLYLIIHDNSNTKKLWGTCNIHFFEGLICEFLISSFFCCSVSLAHHVYVFYFFFMGAHPNFFFLMHANRALFTFFSCFSFCYMYTWCVMWLTITMKIITICHLNKINKWN